MGHICPSRASFPVQSGGSESPGSLGTPPRSDETRSPFGEEIAKQKLFEPKGSGHRELPKMKVLSEFAKFPAFHVSKVSVRSLVKQTLPSRRGCCSEKNDGGAQKSSRGQCLIQGTPAFESKTCKTKQSASR